MFPFVNHFEATSSDDNSLRSDNTNSSGFFQDKGFNQGIEGNEESSPLSMNNQGSTNTGIFPSNVPDFDWRGFSDSELSKSGISFPQNSLEFMSEASLGNYIQQQRIIDQGELNLRDYGGLFANNHNANHMDFPSALEGTVEFPCSNMWRPQKNAQTVPIASGIPPHTISNAPSLTEDSLQPKPQWPVSQQFHQWHHLPYLPFDEQSKAHSNWCRHDEFLNHFTGKELSNLPHLPAEQSQVVQHVVSGNSALGFGSIAAAEVTNTTNLTVRELLLLYIKQKSWGGNRASFLEHMHVIECNHHECKCGQYFWLVSHFDNCDNSNCSICGTVQRSPVKRKNGLSEAFCDVDYNATCTDNSLKRMRIDDPIASRTSHEVAPLTNQPFSAGFNDGDMKWYTEILSFNEGPTSSGVTKTDVVSESQASDLNYAYNFSEELTISCNQREIDHSCMSEIASDAVDDSYHIVPILSEDPIRSLNKDQEKDDIYNSILDINNALNNASTFSEDLGIDCEQGEVDHSSMSEIGSYAVDNFQGLSFDCGPIFSEEHNSCCKEEQKFVDPEIKVKSVSLADFFTAEQMEEHLYSLRQLSGQEVRGKATHFDLENMCQLCSMDKLVFAPTPKYCSFCGTRIKRNMVYHWTLDESGGSEYHFCTKCLNGNRGANIKFNGASIPKSKLQKGKTNEKIEESWVQCGKCEFWQHQICALYNEKRDLEGKGKYVCPKCCLEEIRSGLRVPLPKTAAFEAKDLPRTILSDHIEQRLFTHLDQEREERAMALGKKIDEVPGASGLVVRVVLSVKKQLKVSPQYLGIFQGENYPAEFEYTSKIGYLDYCQKRGFGTCYIWACPPFTGEDYILYCHPEIQKTPKPDKLRSWYKSMLRKAEKENIAVDYTNLYDQFFVPRECNTKITAARLPYFDGGYWSIAAQNIVAKIEQENRGGREKLEKLVTKRTFKSMGHSNPSEGAKDILVMQKVFYAELFVLHNIH
ncbi:hypothetical protein LguiA_017373 [Lonicera macranthoides]